ncbi:Centrosomal protein C10orf90 [Willisornis vidua]|uniref:Centrosomal protein C10orf90 n=1 Tax=Willisornis vidua TaxID=1566151 RepID=A0ABQ9DG01_9PASS|nr:Centrosomal protein C10orf90 [Willisornis vidua]
MIDGNQSKGHQPALPMQSLIPQPSACHTKASLANHGSVKVSRAFLVLPSSRLEIQASLGDTKSPSRSDVPEENQHPRQQQGFASITVTARRVAVGSVPPTRGPGAGQEPRVVPPTSSRAPPALHHRWALPCHTHQLTSLVKTPESYPQSGKEPPKQLLDPGSIKETSVGPPSSGGREKAPPSFLSCVHLQVSQPCPNTIYYVDKSLSVCIDQIKCQKTYRSTLSFSMKCSLSRLTADGVDGIANGEPMEETAPTELRGANKTPLRSDLSADFTEHKVINGVKTKTDCLGSKYPLQSVLISELPAFVETPRGHNRVVATKKEDAEHSGSSHSVFSLQLPNSSDAPGK